MGINKYQTWIRNTFVSSINKNTDRTFDHVYVDLNYLLHKVISYAISEDELINHVIQNLKDIIGRHNPKKTMNIAADGSANYSKILLQKKRRLLSSPERNAQNTGLCSQILTAGTLFMDKFNRKIKDFVKSSSYKFTWNYDLSDHPDESEFKICRFMKNNNLCIFDTHMIISNDADTILISIAQCNMYNVHVLVNISGLRYIVSTDDIVEQFMNNYGYTPSKRIDFILLSLLLGNDYFPKIQCASFDKLFNSYALSIPKNETIIDCFGHINILAFNKFLFNYVKILPKPRKYVNLNEYRSCCVGKYLEGIQWCIQLYMSGEYPSYDYIYFGNSIHPMSIILYTTINNITHINIETSKCKKIPSDICAVITLPLSSKHLIHPKYHKIIENEIKYIYDEELCDVCKKYRNIIHEYDISQIHDKTKIIYNGKNIGSIHKEYISHRKEHDITNPKEYIGSIIQKLKNV